MNFRRSVGANEFWLKDKSMSGDGYLQALFVRKLHMPMTYACMHACMNHNVMAWVLLGCQNRFV